MNVIEPARRVTPRAGIFLAPFNRLADPRTISQIAVVAEDAGWDGLFLWDHVLYRAPTRAVADPWICLAAAATVTDRIRLGALVTPLARRRPQVVARQITTLDHLSAGRMVLGAALGLDRSGRELSAFGEEIDDRVRADMLDEALGVIAALWTGEEVDHSGTHYRAGGVRFAPTPVQRPRIPVWIGGRWPARRPLGRAARWDGYFPMDMNGPDDMAACADAIAGLRGNLEDFDLIAHGPPRSDPTSWYEAGATWWLAGFDPQVAVEEVMEVASRPPEG